ncbi:hypothetical protein A21D_00468 [Virgibacillus dokdonensis]|uniref:Uncharacterized protein n=1 Tax=Virgibacillus dokdonensis TaxID=302167 RepID=A0A2K9J0Q0_9BACI|nr:hypothetical protein A21D_00468 [Virgibacillus dokdonensis]
MILLYLPDRDESGDTLYEARVGSVFRNSIQAV